MNTLRLRQFSSLIALGAALTAVFGACGQFFGINGLPLMLPAVSIVAAVCGSQFILARQEHKEQTVVRRFLELLSHCDGQCPTPILNLQSLPAVDSGSPWYRPLTQIRDYLASFHDRQQQGETIRSALEIRLQRSGAELELMRSILSGFGEPILAVNRYDEVQFANAEAERLFGLTAGEGKRRVGRWRTTEKFATWLADLRRRNSSQRRTEDFEFEVDGAEPRWYRVTAANLAEEGEVGGAVLVLRDVSEHKSVQRRHAEFVSAASHEMRAPLSGIKAYVELLVDGDAEDEATREEFLDVIHGQTDRLQRLVDNLLNIARIEAGVVKVSKQSRGVNEVAVEAAHVVTPAAEAKQIRLTSDLSPLYLGALVDRDMLLQAVINLLSNAVKYTPTGGQVTLRSRLADQEIQIEVEDTGVGLSEDDCRLVFEKFYRVEKDKTMAAGTGLGLALAKHIVEDVHGGKLTVRSRLGAGSTFVITLPHAARNT